MTNKNNRNPIGIWWGVVNILFFLVTLIFILFYLSLKSYWPDLNGGLKVETGLAWNWGGIFFLVVFSILAYSSLLLYKLLILKQHLFWVNKLLTLIFTIFFGSSLIVLYLLNQPELSLPSMILDYYSPIIYGVLIISLALFFPRFIKLFQSLLKNSNIYKVLAISLLLIYITLWFVPLIFTPTTVRDVLPSKPLIFAHRGATSLVPEETIVAGEVSAETGADGWEVDVRMSSDNVLFLMHDKNFIRTTNIADVFPDRKNDNVSTFTIAEIRQLDAGSWFIDDDPYQIFGFGKLDPSDYDKYRGLKIPTFEEVINLTKKLDLILNLDLKISSSDNPLFDDVLFSQLASSGLNPERILLRNNNEKAINMVRLIKNVEEEAIQKNIVLDTSGHLPNEYYDDLHNDNVAIFAGVVNSPERFSQLWCLGVKYVKTDTPQLFTSMSKPGFYFTKKQYLTYWGISVLIGIGIGLISLKKSL